ncbi:MAG: hypothetical protein C0602_10335 [Denitrovibrio sp.]|nr:MAG: hypothetical protein C0602_10335 [Denitrovibrio sp.]
MSLGEITNIIQRYPLLTEVLNSVHDIVLILDSERDIVYFNKKFEEFADNFNLKAQLGVKPGTAFNCIHALDERVECGDTSFCRYCGANKSITESKKGVKSLNECRIAAMHGHAFNLSVSASPLELEGQKLTLYSIIDISAESRRQMLEKIFFHDVNNIVNGMGMIIDMMTDSKNSNDIEEFEHSLDMLKITMTSLKNEINAQHIVSLAEKDELMVHPENVSINKIIKEVVGFIQTTMCNSSVEIDTVLAEPEPLLYTDPVLLKRVLLNTLKNACEASSAGEKVSIGYRNIKDHVLIYVNNPTVMSDKVKSSVFKRSFSTKGQGRGIGTYSMRMLIDRYLKGKIYFTSEEGEGTTFFIKLSVSSQDLL